MTDDSNQHSLFPGNDSPDPIDETYLNQQARRITESDIRRVTDRADEIRSKFSRHNPLGRLLEDGHLMISIVRDYWRGHYRRIPRWALSAIVFALLYALDPLDIIPDLVPGIGYVDDVAVISMCLVMVERELRVYANWKNFRSS